MNRIRGFLGLLCCAMLVASCGGGGSSGGSSTGSSSSSSSGSGQTQAPTILVPPLDTSVLTGTLANFQVAATSPLPLSYQWLRNGQEIAGATSAQYVVVATSDLGGASFSVRVSNSAGSVLSTAGKLTLLSQGSGVVTGSVNAGGGDLDGQAYQAKISQGSIATDKAGNIYQASTSGLVRKITPSGVVTTVLDARSNFSDSSSPIPAITIDKSGALYASLTGYDTSDGRYTITILEKIAVDGTVTTLNSSRNDASQQQSGLAVDASGTLYLSDDTHIDRMTPQGQRSVWLGSSTRGYANGSTSQAAFNGAQGIVLASDGSLYIADTGNHLIRRVSSTGVVSDFAGVAGKAGNSDGPSGSALFNDLSAIALAPDGSLRVLDNQSVRSVSSNGTVSTLYTDPSLQYIYGITVDGNGNTYINTDQTILVMPTGQTPVVLAGQPVSSGASNGSLSLASFNSLSGMVRDKQGNFYLSDGGNYVIRKVSNDGTVSTYAGQVGLSGTQDGDRNTARLGYPSAIAIDSKGNLYVVDGQGESIYGNTYSIRKIDATGAISTVVTDTQNLISGLVLDSTDTLYYAANSPRDYFTEVGACSVIKKLTAGVSSIFAGNFFANGSPCSPSPKDGIGASASFAGIAKLTIDSNDNIYAIDGYAQSSWYMPVQYATTTRIAKIAPSSAVSTLYQTTVYQGSLLRGIAVASNGDIYVNTGYSIAKMGSNSTLTTVSTKPLGGGLLLDPSNNFYTLSSYALNLIRP